MTKPRLLVASALSALLLAAALACGGATDSTLADQECSAPADANPCETCLANTCGQVCRDCVNDTTCYECTKSEEPADDCFADAEVGALVECILGSCQTECEQAPSRKPRDRVGRRKGGGGKGGKRGKRGE